MGENISSLAEVIQLKKKNNKLKGLLGSAKKVACEHCRSYMITYIFRDSTTHLNLN